MSDIIIIALITAGSGIVGALSGSIIGPWLLKRYELKKQIEMDYLEKRRKAIVEYSKAKMESLEVYQNVIYFNQKDDKLISKTNNANWKSTELYSILKKEDKPIKDWLNKINNWAFFSKPKNQQDVFEINSFHQLSITNLLAWHVGEITFKELPEPEKNNNGIPFWPGSKTSVIIK